jgi:DNA ligase (NAD+)
MGRSEKKLTKDEILEKNVSQLAMDALSGENSKKEISLAAFILAFTKGVGEKDVDMLISAGYNTLEKIRSATLEGIDLVIDGKNRLFDKGKIALLIYYGLKEHKEEIDSILQNGNMVIISPKDGEPLRGFSFCFTGELKTMTRNEAKEKIRFLGGSARASVTQDLSFLVTNNPNSPSSKSREADFRNVPKIDEGEFTSILENPEGARAIHDRRERLLENL